MPQLDWTTYPSQLFWLFLSFFFLWGMMAFVVLPPIQKILHKRKNYLADLLEEARVLKEKAEALETNNVAELQAVRLTCEKKVLKALQEKKEALKKKQEDLAVSSQVQVSELTEKMAILKREARQEIQTLIPDLRETLLHHLQSVYCSSEKAEKK